MHQYTKLLQFFEMFTGNMIPNPMAGVCVAICTIVLFLYEDLHVLKIMKTKLETNNIPHCTIDLVKTHNISLFLFKTFPGNICPQNPGN